MIIPRDTEDDSVTIPATQNEQRRIKWRLDAPEARSSSQPSYKQKSSSKQTSGQFLRAESFPTRTRHLDSGYEPVPEEFEVIDTEYVPRTPTPPPPPLSPTPDYTLWEEEAESSCGPFQSFQSFESAFISDIGAVSERGDVDTPNPAGIVLGINLNHAHKANSIVPQHGSASASFADEGYGDSVPSYNPLPISEAYSPDQEIYGDEPSPSVESYFSAPSPLLRDGPRSPSCSSSSSVQTSHCGSSITNNADYREEVIGEIRALSIIIYYLLLRAYIRGSESASASSASSSQESRNENNSQVIEDNGDESGRNQRPNSTPESITQRSNNGSLKRKRDKSDDGEDEGDKPRKNKRVENDNASHRGPLDKQLACPIAKASPNPGTHRCRLINRQNLPGIREHLKRNHFGGKLPEEIHMARTWDDIFRACNPDWDSRIPIPDPYIGSIMGSTVTHIIEQLEIIEESQATTGAPQQNDRSSNNFPSAIPLNGSPAREADSLEPGRDTQIGTPDMSYITSNLTKNQAAIFSAGQAPLSSQFTGFVANSVGHHLSPSMDLEVIEEARSQFQYDLGEYSGQPPNVTFYTMGQYWGVPNSSNMGGALPGRHILSEPLIPQNLDLTSAYEICNGNPTTPSVPSLNVATECTDTSVPSSLEEQTPDQTQSSTITQQSTCTQSQKLSDDPLSLVVARRPIVHPTRENHEPKEFRFEDYHDFRARFENWMTKNFPDPMFSWEEMEFTGTDLDGPIRLSTLNGLLLEVKMYHLMNKSRGAAVHLVMRKGKHRVY
ncbi:hypothetical protein EYR41_010629 [Orbilia oligospora]|uniref:Uncharacterized protein n=1 Tax=Orbilia oligospora TaxID=2813651 RepID=A0A8H2DTL9_ORBOL|nr:hypothetical protein EYR41_010629 [Orbilia oligospora]